MRSVLYSPPRPLHATIPPSKPSMSGRWPPASDPLSPGVHTLPSILNATVETNKPLE
jgi:hypothetical protein